MASEDGRSGKRRRDLGDLDEGSSAEQAAWVPAEATDEAGPAAGGQAQEGGAAAAAAAAGEAAGGALGPAAPALFEVLTRLLVLDRSIRALCS